MPRAAKDAPVVTIRSRDELRDWLAEHHASAKAHLLATFKKPHPDHVPYPACVEELLCWGWIDSTPRRIDDERSAVLIAPRNPKSAWSAVNKAHVERARASGRMQAAGEAKIAAAKANGQWDFLTDVDALIAPDDLLAALGDARAGWDAYPNSVRRGTLEWIKTARTDKTRTARIADVVQAAASGQRPKPYRQADRPSRASSTSKGTPG